MKLLQRSLRMSLLPYIEVPCIFSSRQASSAGGKKCVDLSTSTALEMKYHRKQLTGGQKLTFKSSTEAKINSFLLQITPQKWKENGNKCREKPYECFVHAYYFVASLSQANRAYSVLTRQLKAVGNNRKNGSIKLNDLQPFKVVERALTVVVLSTGHQDVHASFSSRASVCGYSFPGPTQLSVTCSMKNQQRAWNILLCRSYLQVERKTP